MATNSSESVKTVVEPEEWLVTDFGVGLLIPTVVFGLFYEFSCYLLIKVTQRNDIIMKKVLEWATKFNIVCIPFYLIILPALIVLLPASTTFGTWFCDISTFLFTFVTYVNAGLSITTTSMVYVGFVHEAKAKQYGRQFLDKLFCGLSFGIPLIMTIIYLPSSMHQVSYNIPVIEFCYGTPATQSGPPCEFSDDLLHQKYGNWSNTVKTCLQISCWVDMILSLVMFSNIPEIILYILIYSHLKRYVLLKEQFDICFPTWFYSLLPGFNWTYITDCTDLLHFRVRHNSRRGQKHMYDRRILRRNKRYSISANINFGACMIETIGNVALVIL